MKSEQIAAELFFKQKLELGVKCPGPCYRFQ